MSRTNADAEQLWQAAKELRNIADEIVRAHNQFNNARSDTVNAWQSQMTGTFNDRAMATQKRIDALADQIRDTANAVAHTGNAVRQAE